MSKSYSQFADNISELRKKKFDEFKYHKKKLTKPQIY